MRAKEFITEYIGDLSDWVILSKNAILSRIAKGEIPNNPDSIKKAAMDLASRIKDSNGDPIQDVSPEMLAAEVERQIEYDNLYDNSHLGGKIPQ